MSESNWITVANLFTILLLIVTIAIMGKSAVVAYNATAICEQRGYQVGEVRYDVLYCMDYGSEPRIERAGVFGEMRRNGGQ